VTDQGLFNHLFLPVFFVVGMLDNNIVTVYDDTEGTPKVNIGGEWYDIYDDPSLFPSDTTTTPCPNWTDSGYISGGKGKQNQNKTLKYYVSLDICMQSKGEVIGKYFKVLPSK
jgi:hypothetical protein